MNLLVNWLHSTVGGHLKLAEREIISGTDKKGKLIVDIGIMRTKEVIYQKRHRAKNLFHRETFHMISMRFKQMQIKYVIMR